MTWSRGRGVRCALTYLRGLSSSYLGRDEATRRRFVRPRRRTRNKPPGGAELGHSTPRRLTIKSFLLITLTFSITTIHAPEAVAQRPQPAPPCPGGVDGWPPWGGCLEPDNPAANGVAAARWAAEWAEEAASAVYARERERFEHAVVEAHVGAMWALFYYGEACAPRSVMTVREFEGRRVPSVGGVAVLWQIYGVWGGAFPNTSPPSDRVKDWAESVLAVAQRLREEAHNILACAAPQRGKAEGQDHPTAFVPASTRVTGPPLVVSASTAGERRELRQ